MLAYKYIHVSTMDKKDYRFYTDKCYYTFDNDKKFLKVLLREKDITILMVPVKNLSVLELE